MFDQATIDQWKGIYNGAVAHDTKWKRIPASDARLKSMAKLLSREYQVLVNCKEESYYASMVGATRKLSNDEKAKFNKYFELEKRDSKC